MFNRQHVSLSVVRQPLFWFSSCTHIFRNSSWRQMGFLVCWSTETPLINVNEAIFCFLKQLMNWARALPKERSLSSSLFRSWKMIGVTVSLRKKVEIFFKVSALISMYQCKPLALWDCMLNYRVTRQPWFGEGSPTFGHFSPPSPITPSCLQETGNKHNVPM